MTKKTILLIIMIFLLSLVFVACDRKVDVKNAYPLIDECSNEMACYNTLFYAAASKVEKFGYLMLDSDIESLFIESAHGDICTENGRGILYISYSFTIDGTKYIFNESYNVKDYGLLKNTISFRSDESICPNAREGLPSYIDIDKVNYYLREFHFSYYNQIPYNKAEFDITFTNYDGTILGKKTIVGYGTKIVYDGENPVKEGDKEFYYVFSNWHTTNGDNYDLIARKDEILVANFIQKNVKYSVYLRNPDGTIFRVYKDIYNYGAKPWISLKDIGDFPKIHYSDDIMPCCNDLYYLFDGWEETEYIESIDENPDSIETSFNNVYYLKPIENDVYLTAKYNPISIYEFIPNGDGTYEAKLLKDFLYYDCIFGNEVLNGRGTVTIPSKAFRVDSEGKKIEIGDVSSISSSCFYLSKKLSILNLPNTIRIIKSNAFSNCHLRNIILNEGLEEIGDGAFKDTTPSIIYIPKSVKSIGKKAFNGYGQYNTVIVYEGSKTDWSKISIGENNEYITSCSSIIFDTSYDEYLNKH